STCRNRSCTSASWMRWTRPAPPSNPAAGFSCTRKIGFTRPRWQKSSRFTEGHQGQDLVHEGRGEPQRGVYITEKVDRKTGWQFICLEGVDARLLAGDTRFHGMRVDRTAARADLGL